MSSDGKVRALAIVAIAALAFSACDGRDKRSSGKSSSTTTTAEVTTTTATAEPCGGVSTIPAAVETSPVAGLSEAPDLYDVVDTRVAASDPTWGGFSDVPSAGNEATFQGGYGVVHCESDEWVVYDVGTSEVGCGGGSIPEVPPAVRTDLGLECPT